jgi:2-phosphoglycolate phosphatase
MALPLSSYAAVLFDFDGTLADSYAAIAASVNHVRGGRGLAPLSVEEVKRHVGRGPEYLLAHTIPGGRLAEDLPRYRAHHPGVMARLTHLLPGAAEVLAALAKTKQIGLCSNKPRLFSQELLAHLGVASYFSVVVGPEDVPRPKPAPDMLRFAIERLSVPLERVLYVGDMTVDIQTARAAGVHVWIVPTGSDEAQVLRDANPDRMLTDLREILADLG